METPNINLSQLLPPKKSGAQTIVMLVGGVIMMLFWLMVYLWAQGHSPHMGFIEMLSISAQDPKHFIFNPQAYAMLMLVIAGGELFGFWCS